MHKILSLSLGIVFLISLVAATQTNFYYSPTCPHCQQVTPLVQELSKTNNINAIDVSQGSYDVPGVPMISIKTNDGREITLIGSQEIPTYLECELNEISSERCPTYSSQEGINCESNSWFIR